MMPKINRTTMRTNGQRGTWLNPQADHSEKPEQALRKACSAWVVNNGCINEFIKSLHESGYFLVLVPTDAPCDVRVVCDDFPVTLGSCN